MVRKYPGRSNAAARNLLNALLAATPEDAKKFLDKMNEVRSRAEEDFGKLKKLVKSSKGLELLNALTDARAKYRAALEQDMKLIEEGAKDKAVVFLFKEVIPPQTIALAALDGLVGYQWERIDHIGKEALDQARSATVLVMASRFRPISWP